MAPVLPLTVAQALSIIILEAFRAASEAGPILGSYHGKRPGHPVRLPYRDAGSSERFLHGSEQAGMHLSGGAVRDCRTCWNVTPSSEAAPHTAVSLLGTAGKCWGLVSLSPGTFSERIRGRRKAAWSRGPIDSAACGPAETLWIWRPLPFLREAISTWQKMQLRGKRSINKTKNPRGMGVESRGPNPGGELILLWFEEMALSPNNLCSELGRAG